LQRRFGSPKHKHAAADENSGSDVKIPAVTSFQKKDENVNDVAQAPGAPANESKQQAASAEVEAIDDAKKD
jgi:hypothetical protein